MHITTLTPEEALISLNTSARQEVRELPGEAAAAGQGRGGTLGAVFLPEGEDAVDEDHTERRKPRAAWPNSDPTASRRWAVRDGTVMQTELGALVPGDGE